MGLFKNTLLRGCIWKCHFCNAGKGGQSFLKLSDCHVTTGISLSCDVFFKILFCGPLLNLYTPLCTTFQTENCRNTQSRHDSKLTSTRSSKTNQMLFFKSINWRISNLNTEWPTLLTTSEVPLSRHNLSVWDHCCVVVVMWNSSSAFSLLLIGISSNSLVMDYLTSLQRTNILTKYWLLVKDFTRVRRQRAFLHFAWGGEIKAVTRSDQDERRCFYSPDRYIHW